MLWEKEKLLITSNFSFSHSVFKTFVSQGHQKASLCGNGLSKASPSNVTNTYLHIKMNHVPQRVHRNAWIHGSANKQQVFLTEWLNIYLKSVHHIIISALHVQANAQVQLLVTVNIPVIKGHNCVKNIFMITCPCFMHS